MGYAVVSRKLSLFSFVFVRTAPQSYLFRVHTDSLLNTELHLTSVDRFVINEQHQQFIVGIIIGIAIAAFIYFLICYRRYRLQLALAAAAYCAVISIFIPSWVGLLHSGFALTSELDGCLESLSINFSAIAHTLVVLFLGWRQRWVQLTLWAFIALQVVIGSGEFWLYSALNAVSIRLGIAVTEIFMLFLLIFARREPKTASTFALVRLCLCYCRYCSFGTDQYECTFSRFYPYLVGYCVTDGGDIELGNGLYAIIRQSGP